MDRALLRDRFLDQAVRDRIPACEFCENDPPRFLPLAEEVCLSDARVLDAVLVDQRGVPTLVAFCEGDDAPSQLAAAESLVARADMFLEEYGVERLFEVAEGDWKVRAKPGWDVSSLPGAVDSFFGDWFSKGLRHYLESRLLARRIRLFLVTGTVSEGLAEQVGTVRAHGLANLYGFGIGGASEDRWTLTGTPSEFPSVETQSSSRWHHHRMRHGKLTLGRRVNPGCYEAVIDGPGTLRDPLRILVVHWGQDWTDGSVAGPAERPRRGEGVPGRSGSSLPAHPS